MIDPRREKRLHQARALAAQHGAQLRPHGRAWHVCGNGHDFLLADPAQLTSADFRVDPPPWQSMKRGPQ